MEGPVTKVWRCLHTNGCIFGSGFSCFLILRFDETCKKGGISVFFIGDCGERCGVVYIQMAILGSGFRFLNLRFVKKGVNCVLSLWGLGRKVQCLHTNKFYFRIGFRFLILLEI